MVASGGTAKTGDFRWRLQAANGRVLAESGQGFRDRTDANRSIHDLLDALDDQPSPHAPIVDVDD